MASKPGFAFVEPYDRVARLSEHAVRDVTERIEDAVRALGDKNLVRAELVAPRIKSKRSLLRKARQRGWTRDEALSRAPDLVGFRLVCHNLQDASRAADLLEISLRGAGVAVERQDHRTTPKVSGYRAIHLMFRLPVRIGDDEAEIGCEIQIRSLLENAWAELSRADVYTEAVPASIERQMQSLSRQLARADATADKIRNRIARPRRGRHAPADEPLTEAAIAFIFRDVFGDDAPDYLVRVVARETAGEAPRADGLHALLKDDTFITRLKKAYANAAGWEAEPPQIFLWAVHGMVAGREAAVRQAAREARIEWAEIRSIAQRELLPDAEELDEALTSLEFARKDDDAEEQLTRWASALGASTACVYCGTAIVDTGRLATAAIKHYGARGKRASSLRRRFSSLTGSSALESGSWDDSGVCGYCSYKLTKD